MRAVIQRVRRASVAVDDEVVGSISRGYLILLGVGRDDTRELAQRLWDKIFALRINEDENGRTNRALSDAGGSVLVVSQFTLYADCRRGRRPSFTSAAEPAAAEELYEWFCACARADVGRVEHGVFGAHMRVDLVNDGPFTIVLDTDELF